MFRQFILLVSLILCFSGTANAQISPCSADAHYQELLAKYPELASYEQQFEEQIARRIAERTTAAVDTNTYDLPMVIHVVHDYGAENLTDDVLYDAAAYWAVVYMKQNLDTNGVIAPFIPYIGNPKIRLHLATIDPNGNPTKGVVRVNSYLTINADDQAKFNQWPQNKYVNIWFISAFGAEDAGAAAYAYLPGSVSMLPYYDGIICLASYANYAKTVPHEMGHVLNLKHPWGNTNNPGVACGDDNVDDTPPTMGHLPSGCVPSALYDTVCATGYLKHYTSSLGADSIANYPDTANSQNIMDYTYCQEMFTKGQCVRMRTALTSATAGRSNLITPANLAATGALAPMPDLPPVADFIMNKASGAGIIPDNRTYFMTFNNAGSFVFRNASWNDTISGVSWAFSNGATTPVSTSTNVVYNQFSTPGWVTVSLVANSNAGTGTLVNTHAVYAADTAAIPAFSYAQQFSSPADISNWPMFNYYNNQFKWEFYTGAGYAGSNTCMRYRSFDTSLKITGTGVGDHDDFYTPAFNLTNITGGAYLNFYSAGATTPAVRGVTAVGDSMEIDASVNGGARWTKIKGFNTSQLVNDGNWGTDFVPASATDWKAQAVSIPAAYFTGQTFFRFRYFPGNTGNNFYLDNVYLYMFPAGVKEALNTPNSVNVFPNPATNGCTLVLKTGNDGMVAYSIKDLSGKLVFETRKQLAPNSVAQETIPRSVTPAAGMYFITITTDGMSTTEKLVVY